MNPQENRELERRLREIEAQINQQSSPRPFQSQPGQLPKLQSDRLQSIQSFLQQVTNWFNGLSGVGKAVVISAAAIVGLMVLKTVFQLVTSLISLAIVGVLLYLVYKFFVAAKASK